VPKIDIHFAAREFFEDFAAVFATFSGPRIAERYAAPYLAIRSDGSSEVYDTAESIAEYFQGIVDGYHARGCRICKYKDLAIVPIGSVAALGTVTWELCRMDDTAVTTWRESYTLVFLDGRMKAAASVDHAA
jgi:hypothetical protein